MLGAKWEWKVARVLHRYPTHLDQRETAFFKQAKTDFSSLPWLAETTLGFSNDFCLFATMTESK